MGISYHLMLPFVVLQYKHKSQNRKRLEQRHTFMEIHKFVLVILIMNLLITIFIFVYSIFPGIYEMHYEFILSRIIMPKLIPFRCVVEKKLLFTETSLN